MPQSPPRSTDPRACRPVRRPGGAARAAGRPVARGELAGARPGHGRLRQGAHPRRTPARRDGGHLRAQHARVDPGRPRHPGRARRQRAHLPDQHPRSGQLHPARRAHPPALRRRTAAVRSGPRVAGRRRDCPHRGARRERRPARLPRGQPLQGLPRRGRPPAERAGASTARSPVPDGRPADADLHLGHHRRTQGRDAGLRQHRRLLRDARPAPRPRRARRLAVHAAAQPRVRARLDVLRALPRRRERLHPRPAAGDGRHRGGQADGDVRRAAPLRKGLRRDPGPGGQGAAAAPRPVRLGHEGRHARSSSAARPAPRSRPSLGSSG